METTTAAHETDITYVDGGTRWTCICGQTNVCTTGRRALAAARKHVEANAD